MPSSALRRLGRWLALAGAGVVALVAGLAWDVVLHGDDPDLAHRESLLTLGNPGHAVFLAGVVAVVAGVGGALLVTSGIADRRETSPDGGSTAPPTARTLAVLGVAVALVAGAGVGAWAVRPAGSAPDAPGAAGSAPDAEGAAGTVGAAAAPTHGERHDAAAAPPTAQAAPDHAPGAPHGTAACAPTPDQQAAADRLYADTEAGLAGLRDLAAATAAGYRRITPAGWSTVHYLNDAHAIDGAVLDPARPEALIFANTRRGPVLAAAMYLMRFPGEAGPAVGGCLTRWHTHDDLCFSVQAAEVVSLTSPTGACPPGTVNYRPPEMMHVWVVDVPEGRFAHDVDEAALARRLGR